MIFFRNYNYRLRASQSVIMVLILDCNGLICNVGRMRGYDFCQWDKLYFMVAFWISLTLHWNYLLHWSYVDRTHLCRCILLPEQQVAFTIAQFPALSDFLRHFQRTWFRTFPVEMWDVFHRALKLRTTNHCESWNNRGNLQTRRAFSIFDWLLDFSKFKENCPKIKFSIWRLGTYLLHKQKMEVA